MNSDFQIVVWSFKGIQNVGETRGNKVAPEES